MRLPLKILLLVPKPTEKLLPSFPHNFHLCPSRMRGIGRMSCPSMKMTIYVCAGLRISWSPRWLSCERGLKQHAHYCRSVPWLHIKDWMPKSPCSKGNGWETTRSTMLSAITADIMRLLWQLSSTFQPLTHRGWSVLWYQESLAVRRRGRPRKCCLW